MRSNILYLYIKEAIHVWITARIIDGFWLERSAPTYHAINFRAGEQQGKRKRKSQSESESELLFDWRFTANQFILATSPLRPTTSNFILQLNTCEYCPYVTSFLTRGWFCRLQLLLVLASAVILRSESRGTHNHILSSRIRDSPNLESQVPVFISPRTGWPSYNPQALGFLFPFSCDSEGYGGGIRPRLLMGRQGERTLRTLI
jgi:hypothetical protein